MTVFKHGLFTATAVAGLICVGIYSVRAEDVTATTSETTVQKTRTDWVKNDETVLPPGTRIIDLSKLDANGDGILTKHEIGDALFKIFDTDGNGLIDNVEFEKRTIATVVPVKETMKMSYYSGDNIMPDKTVVTSGEFLKATQLARFSTSAEGLSAHDFAQKTFADADVNHDHFIDLKEWEGVYDASVNAENVKKQEYSLNK